MTPLRFALLGAEGQLGRTLRADWSQDDTQNRIRLHSFNKAALDITDPGALANTLGPLSLDILINAAAYTAVDRAETEQESAMKINRDGAGQVAQWAKQNQCCLIHISTDFVFDGHSSNAYRPADTTAPLNVYGATKLAGEQVIRQSYPQRSVIIRTSWLYSIYGNNFVKTMLHLMATKPSLKVVADQIGSPTSAHSLVQFISSVVSSTIDNGVYHWADAGEASWYDFAVAIQEEALEIGLLNNAIAIEPISSEEFPTAATRPKNSVLDKGLSHSSFNCSAAPWRENLKRVLREIAQTTGQTKLNN